MSRSGRLVVNTGPGDLNQQLDEISAFAEQVPS